MKKIKLIILSAAVTLSYTVLSQAEPLPSGILTPSEIEKPALCETARRVTSDLYQDDQGMLVLLIPGYADQRPQSIGLMLPSSMEYFYNINQDLNGYRNYVSLACKDYAKKLANVSCAIESKFNPIVNMNVISKPQSAQITARILNFHGYYSSTYVNLLGFDEAATVSNPNPVPYDTLNYQVTCDGDGQVINIVEEQLSL